MKNIFLDKNTTIAIIGFGRFGQLLTKILLKNSLAQIVVVSSKKIRLSHQRLAFKTIDGINNADIIIPCVPIASFASVIKQIAKFIKPETIIIDVCSVKMLPVDIMKANLPLSAQIVASHPMFGPDSYRIKKRLDSFKLVTWNVRAKKKNYQQIKKFYNGLGIKIIELSPEDHDKLMAYSLAYSYFVGKIGQRMNIKKTPIDTYDFQLLLRHLSIVRNDSEQLFLDMQTKNPFAKQMHKSFKKALADVLIDISQSATENKYD
jgi:prephenate dehydrogenase